MITVTPPAYLLMWNRRGSSLMTKPCWWLSFEGYLTPKSKMEKEAPTSSLYSLLDILWRERFEKRYPEIKPAVYIVSSYLAMLVIDCMYVGSDRDIRDVQACVPIIQRRTWVPYFKLVYFSQIEFFYLSGCLNRNFGGHRHHHHVVLLAQISSTLSRHPILSSIAPRKYQHRAVVYRL